MRSRCRRGAVVQKVTIFLQKIVTFAPPSVGGDVGGGLGGCGGGDVGVGVGVATAIAAVAADADVDADADTDAAGPRFQIAAMGPILGPFGF